MSVVKLTPQFINKNLVCPESRKRIEFVNDDRSGLYIEVRKASPGKGTYYLRYKNVHGKSCNQRLGSTDELTLTEAKEKTKQLKAEINLGADPRAEERAKLAVITFDDFFHLHYLPYAKQHKRSWKRDEELYRLRIADKFGARRLNQVSRLQILNFQSELAESSLAAASVNHHIKLIRHLFNRAIEWGMVDENPAKHMKMLFEDNKREKYMNDEELQRLLGVLKTDHRRSVCLIALFLLSTGARLNEALSATWDNVDLEKRAWLIEATNSKSKRSRSVPLNDSAIEVLNQLDTKGDFEHLFINKRTKKPYVSVHKVWDEIRKKAGLPHLRIHDLRHQFASFLVNGGSTLYEVQQILGHSAPIVTMRYSHLSDEALQKASSKASLAMQSVSQESPKLKVVAGK